MPPHHPGSFCKSLHSQRNSTLCRAVECQARQLRQLSATAATQMQAFDKGPRLYLSKALPATRVPSRAL